MAAAGVAAAAHRTVGHIVGRQRKWAARKHVHVQRGREKARHVDRGELRVAEKQPAVDVDAA